MSYLYDDNPFGRWPKSNSLKELRRAFALLAPEIVNRSRRISEYFDSVHGFNILPSSDDADIDLLPSLIAKEGSLEQINEEDFMAELTSKLGPVKAAGIAAVMSRDALDDRTYSMVFDGGLLWGEAFRFRYPLAEWALARPPQSSVHFGQPVLAGTNKRRTEFAPIGELYGSVGLLLLGSSDEWPLSKLMKMRAYTMGYGPDPRQ